MQKFTRLWGQKKFFFLISLGIVFLMGLGILLSQPILKDRFFSTLFHADTTDVDSDEVELAPAPDQSITPTDLANIPSDGSVLPGNVLIADRGNNRLIEVTPDKKIVWQLNFNDLYPGLPLGFGADDAFFTPNGKSVIVNLEEYHTLAEIDYQSKQVIWQYGHPGNRGSADGYLNTPDDAYRWPNGLTSVADIKNCRVLFIDKDKNILKQFGEAGKCFNRPGFYNKPNGDTPLPNGDTLVSIINGHQVAEVRPDGSEVFRLTVPLSYPSDAQLLQDGNILIADYTQHGRVIEITKDGQVVWDYFYPNDPVRGLNHPSLAIQLPNKDILLNDDANHRVIVIDYTTKRIVWQYGVTGKAGKGPGQLNIPDGLDIHSLQLHLPLDTSLLPAHPKSFGFYPFGLISSDHPEGHAGFNFESTQNTPVLAPTTMKVIKITSPAGRPDEHNLIAQVGSYQLEFLRIGTLTDGIEVGSEVKEGIPFAFPGFNRSLNTWMFHMGLLDMNDNAVCPEQYFWSNEAWTQLTQLLSNSHDPSGHPYQKVCYSALTIPRSVRHME